MLLRALSTLADATATAAADESFTVFGSRAELVLSMLLRALFEPPHCDSELLLTEWPGASLSISVDHSEK